MGGGNDMTKMTPSQSTPPQSKQPQSKQPQSTQPQLPPTELTTTDKFALTAATLVFAANGFALLALWSEIRERGRRGNQEELIFLPEPEIL